MDVLANSFIRSNKETREGISMRNIVYHNHLFREHLGKNSEFLKYLTTLLNQSEDMKSKLNVTGILLSLGGYISNKEIIRRVLENIVFPIIKNNQSSKEYVDKILDFLMETSAIDESKSILLEFGTKDIIQPFVDDQGSEYHFVSCVIQAFLSSNDVNQNNEFGSNPTSPKVISKILDVINNFINTEAQIYIYTENYCLNCYHVLKSLGSLARNEANMKELKNKGIVKKIIEFITNRKDNLLKTSERTIEELSTMIWSLSFDQDCKNEFLSKKIDEVLKGFNVKDNESAKRAVDGALFTLIGNQNQNRNEIKRQVMISYCWAQKEKARRIGNYLKSKNILVWIDIEQMEGSILERMAEAVEESSVILIFLSSKYKESQACRTEGEYAYKLKKEIIYIMAEDNYQPRGWLGAMLGNKLWYNPWKNELLIEQLFLPILSHLSKIFNQPEIEIKSTQIMNDSQSTNNDQDQNQHRHQQILDHLEKICNKIDGFENKLQKVEENYENVNKKFEKLEIQNKEKFEAQSKENLEGLEKIEQRLQKVEIQNKENFERLENQNKENFEALGKMGKKIETVKQQFDQMEAQSKENHETLGKMGRKLRKLEAQNKKSFKKMEQTGKMEQRLQNMEILEKVAQQQTKQIIFVSVAVAVICVCLFLKK